MDGGYDSIASSFISTLEQLHFRFRQRQLQIRLWQMLLWWLLCCLISTVLWWVFSSPIIWLGTVAAVVAISFFYILLLYRRKISLAQTAIHLDRIHGLENRLSSAYFSLQKPSCRWTSVLVADSYRYLAEIRDKDHFFPVLKLPKWYAIAGLVLLISLVSLLSSRIAKSENIQDEKWLRAASQKVQSLAHSAENMGDRQSGKKLLEIAKKWQSSATTTMLAADIDELEEIARDHESVQLSRQWLKKTLHIDNSTTAQGFSKKIRSLSAERQKQLVNTIAVMSPLKFSREMAKAIAGQKREQIEKAWSELPESTSKSLQISTELRETTRKLRERIGLPGAPAMDSTTFSGDTQMVAGAHSQTSVESAPRENYPAIVSQERDFSSSKAEKAWWPEKYHAVVKAYFTAKAEKGERHDEKQKRGSIDQK